MLLLPLVQQQTQSLGMKNPRDQLQISKKAQTNPTRVCQFSRQAQP
jgi:hypothetical protein